MADRILRAVITGSAAGAGTAVDEAALGLEKSAARMQAANDKATAGMAAAQEKAAAAGTKAWAKLGEATLLALGGAAVGAVHLADGFEKSVAKIAGSADISVKSAQKI